MVSPGVLIISHGSRESSWVELVDEAVNQLPLQESIPVAVSFLELVQGRLIQDGINQLEAQGVTDIITIPLFVSSGSTHVDEIAYALGVKETADCETDLAPFHIQANIHYGLPMDDDPDIAQMIWDKVRDQVRDQASSSEHGRQVILLIGHGSIYEHFRVRWEQGLSSLASKVKAMSDVVTVDYALLNPDSVKQRMEYWINEQGFEVIVFPLFLSEGYFTQNVIPGRLEEFKYRYTGEALLPHPLLSHWIGKQIYAMLQMIK
ncbi:sirohydrochlorin chelatase [Paenibacillus crassostreae]|uniref:Cobalamin biosynthesis protein CbiX n=1 Tax=Paenibacillus crassostreae TaxID=1763538 RepID=A0A167AU16_9BACL|nr:CbiX/SirB N-terminal domain-containing protein [Paenibacillus crassostreae]AOZ93600.1 cobalamin biosynthesis protein CbiX [Paenibacillus crassostreae]OAB71426.1 cobalamin biosynthesis protein CbiX [Paenibacillus crassostreae]